MPKISFKGDKHAEFSFNVEFKFFQMITQMMMKT